MAILAAVGCVTIATFRVTVVMGQEYLPGRVGLASGVTLGLAIGLGGVWARFLGLVADRFGLVTVMELIAVLPLAGPVLALTLPRDAPGPAAQSSPSAGRRASGSTPRELSTPASMT